MHIIEIKILDGDVHRNRNFGEDVWRIYRNERGVEISLDEIDRSVDCFPVRVGRRKSVLLVCRKLRHHLKRHGLRADLNIQQV